MKFNFKDVLDAIEDPYRPDATFTPEEQAEEEYENTQRDEEAQERQGCEDEEREKYENQRLREVQGYE